MLLQDEVLAELSALVRAGVTDPQAEGGELLGDLEVGERGADGDVAVAAVVLPPLALVAVDGADAGDGAARDVDDRFDVGAAGRGDRPPLAVGLQLDGLALAGLAEPPVAGVGFGLGVAVDHEGAGRPSWWAVRCR